jgi:hypothetical protein
LINFGFADPVTDRTRSDSPTCKQAQETGEDVPRRTQT